MRLLIDQLENSLASGNYFLSLFTALTLPDIAGALNAQDGKATGVRYAAWYEQWVRPRLAETVQATLSANFPGQVLNVVNPLDGDACYRFRCSLLHQGSTQHPKSPYERIIFIEPHATSNSFHYCTLNKALCIDLQMFCQEMISGVRLWLTHAEATPLYQANFAKFATRHDQGLPPYIVGVPVVG
ncbi:hypothetical protein [Perlucidibaca aquatica]|uniref:hypothetical protein n=1 Tax=Perlucidibaca aquatica TaxID=1852776 RepID=UPI00083A5175|nr:hypothetical protein [Perlucidibaca aquatica]